MTPSEPIRMEAEGEYPGRRAGPLPKLIGLRLHPWQGLMIVAGVLLAEAVVFVAGAMLFSWLGIYDIAATSNHTKAFGWFLHFTMRNSVKAHAAAEAPPLDDARLIAKGERYSELRCAPCHGSPGRAPDVSAGKMLPSPPNIATLTRGFTPAQLHWIIKHGVKMTAMPAWASQQRDDEIWPLVAYLEHVGKNPGRTLTEPSGQPREKVDADARPGLGGKVTAATCHSCHGADGNGRGGVFPKLAGLSEDYIRSSLEDYRSGARQSGYMQPFAADLSDAEIAALVSSFKNHDRTPEMSNSADAHLLQRGAAIAEPALSTRPTPACMSCHLPNNSRQSPAIPSLAGQPARYIATQLKLFRSAIRGGTGNARIMQRVAQRLSDSDIEALAAYFAARPTRSGDEEPKAAEGADAR